MTDDHLRQFQALFLPGERRRAAQVIVDAARRDVDNIIAAARERAEHELEISRFFDCEDIHFWQRLIHNLSTTQAESMALWARHWIRLPVDDRNALRGGAREPTAEQLDFLARHGVVQEPHSYADAARLVASVRGALAREKRQEYFKNGT